MEKQRPPKLFNSDAEKKKRFSLMTSKHVRSEISVLDTPYPNYLYKYLNSNIDSDKLSCLLINSDLFLSSRTVFNDPFDSTACIMLNTNKQKQRKDFEFFIKEGLKQNDQKMNALAVQAMVSDQMAKIENIPFYLEDFMVSHINNIGMYCLSENNKNILMWSHYANNHEGLVLEFDVAEAIEAFFPAFKITYSSHYPILNFLNKNEKEYFKLLTTKYSNWNYEEEWRLIRTNGAYKYLAFNPKALVSLTFGCKAGNKIRSLVSELLKKRDELGLPKIQIKQAYLHESEFELWVE